jgi:hypothetical protein
VSRLQNTRYSLVADPVFALEVFCQALCILGWAGGVVWSLQYLWTHIAMRLGESKSIHTHKHTPLLQAGRSALQRNLQRRGTQSQTSPSRICLGRLYNTAARELGAFTQSGNMRDSVARRMAHYLTVLASCSALHAGYLMHILRYVWTECAHKVIPILGAGCGQQTKTQCFIIPNLIDCLGHVVKSW